MGNVPLTTGPMPQIDVTRPHAARVYDHHLGGKDNFAADREMGDKILAIVPYARTAARENRAFMGRAVRPEAAAVLAECRVPPRLEPLQNRLHRARSASAEKGFGANFDTPPLRWEGDGTG